MSYVPGPSKLTLSASDIAAKAAADVQKKNDYMAMSYSVSSNALNIGLASNLRGLIQNPADSGRYVIVERIVGWTTVGVVTARLRKNPTINLPTTVRDAVSVYVGDDDQVPQPVAVVKFDAGQALGGGTDTGEELMFNPNSPGNYSGRWRINPGYSLGFNLPFLLAAVGTFSLRFSEGPL